MVPKEKADVSPANVAHVCYAPAGQKERRGRSRAEKSHQHCGCYAPAAQKKRPAFAGQEEFGQLPTFAWRGDLTRLVAALTPLVE
jgi:hypothetical protein